MAKIIKFIVIVMGVIFLGGCGDKCTPRLLLVKYPIKVYKTHTGECMDYVFTLQPGDQCAIGIKKEEKVFSFIEIVSQKGYGWILEKNGYTIIDRSNVASSIPVK